MAARFLGIWTTFFLLFCVAEQALSAPALEIKIGYLRTPKLKQAISLLDVPAANDGLAGAELAVADNNTTGKFTGQRFTLVEKTLAPDQDPAEALSALSNSGAALIVADLPAPLLLKVSDLGRERGLLIFNATVTDDELREANCRANVIHIAPARSMLADALAQYLVWKQWRNWVLFVGSHEEDRLWADALRRAARRFAAKIVAERVFEDKGGARRTDSGIAQIQQQIPLATQGLPSYDVLVAADESEVFAGYLPYRTSVPRPVAGSAGLMPTSWDASSQQWGAIQLQNRFMKAFSRRMTANDMGAWMAGRAIGEAVTRTKSADPKVLLDFLRGPDFSLAAFKGQGLTLRPWNQQLRQPILLSDGRNVVSVSPQPGFLHQFSELDTLGYDKPETKCELK